MRVLYDYQAFLQRQGGVSRYFAELIEALKRIEGYEACIPSFFSDNEYLPSKRAFLTRGHFKGKERIMGLLNRIGSRAAFRSPFDVFHPTYYSPYFIGRLRHPLVITVHDMIHEILGGVHVSDDGTARNKAALCAAASQIIAVSQNTKDDLCRLLRVPKSKVSVIHHATNLRYDGEPRVHERPYLLYVGARGGYKNFGTFFEAAAVVLGRHDVDLVCVGGGGFTRSDTSSAAARGLVNRMHHYPAPSPGQLASLYHFASVFCYPSLYEGFGIPILEAFACGCPVAASRTSSIPEVAGDAVEFFDPESVESMAVGVGKVLADAERSRALASAGAARLRSFSWDQAARLTYEVYGRA